MLDYLTKAKKLSKEYTLARERYAEAKKQGASEDELKRLRRLKDNARKIFQQAL